MEPNPGALGLEKGSPTSYFSTTSNIPTITPPITSTVTHSIISPQAQPQVPHPAPPGLSRYESQKRRDWITFLQYLKDHKPPLSLSRCSGAHVIEFLKYLDQFGKTKVHIPVCSYFGLPNPPSPCGCSLRQAWGSLDALIGRLRAAYEENGGQPGSNPFGARAVRFYLREIRASQAKARGIPYEKKKRKRSPKQTSTFHSGASSSVAASGEGEGKGSSRVSAEGSDALPPPSDP